MMCLTENKMTSKILLIFYILGLSLYSCTNSFDDYYKSCPYEFKYGLSHYLKVPINVVPHKQFYNVSDTLSIEMNFSNDIYDLTRSVSFSINGFPFRPIIQVYRFTASDQWESGVTLNNLVMDSTYIEGFTSSATSANTIFGKTIFEGDRYMFNVDIELNKKGVYVLVVSDYYMQNLGSGNSDANSYANEIEFEGRCPDTDFFICNIIESGSLHINEYHEILQYLDKEVYRDQLARVDVLDTAGYFGSGGIGIDWTGFLTVEVN